MIISIRSTVLAVTAFIYAKNLKILFPYKTWRDSDSTGVVIKMFINYFQILSALFTFQLAVPAEFRIVNDVGGNPVQQMGYSMQVKLIY